MQHLAQRSWNRAGGSQAGVMAYPISTAMAPAAAWLDATEVVPYDGAQRGAAGPSGSLSPAPTLGLAPIAGENLEGEKHP